MKTAITSILVALAFVGLVLIVSCEKEPPQQPEPQKAYQPYELIRMKASGAEVTEGMVKEAREQMLANLIKGTEHGQDKSAQPKVIDTTFNAVFQVYNPQATTTGFRVWHRIKIYNGTFTPDIYSMCYIVKHSPGLVPLNSSILLEYQSNCVDFPPQGHGYGTVITHVTSQGMYFVFFSLSPFQLDWVDRIILEMRYNKLPGYTNFWLTIDRSDPNNFALSSDGYTDYRTYFFPDTLKWSN